MDKRYFFDTFGYATFDCKINKTELINCFENDVQIKLNLPSLDGTIPEVGIKNRTNNIRCANLTSECIYSVFYNPIFLDEIYKLTDDFFIASPMESFYLTNSSIHRDLASELKQIKVLFYLDDLSTIDKGPLYTLPGTHNIYDKYSSSIGENVAWPSPEKGGGANFCIYSDYLNKNIPKTYFYSNVDKIILFNLNLFHGSDGNLNNPNILRRCIGMTLICIDRSNEALMKKLENFFFLYNIDNSNSNAYKFCKKYNLTKWLNHFYFPDSTNKNFQHSLDGTDKNSIILAKNSNRWKHYLDYFLEPIFKNRNTLLNCFESQAKAINNIDTENSYDYLGL